MSNKEREILQDFLGEIENALHRFNEIDRVGYHQWVKKLMYFTADITNDLRRAERWHEMED